MTAVRSQEVRGALDQEKRIAREMKVRGQVASTVKGKSMEGQGRFWPAPFGSTPQPAKPLNWP